MEALMDFLDEYDDDALIKWEILSRVEYAINAGNYQRINLHNLALSLNGTYKIKEIVDLIYAVKQALDSDNDLTAGQWPYEDMNDGTPFAQDEDYYCLIKASSKEDAQRKEQALKTWLTQTAEMLDQLNS